MKALGQTVGDLRPHHLTPLHVHGLVASWKQIYARSTLFQRCASLRQFFRWLRASGGPDCLSYVPRIPQPRPRNRVALPDELEKLERHANPTMQALIALVVDTATRISEALAIAPVHYNAEKQILTIPQVKDHGAKKVPVSPRLRELFEALPPTPPFQPILETIHGAPLNYKTVEVAWFRLKKKAGVDTHLRLHDLRRTTATALYEVSRDVFAVQQLLGHQTLAATTHYISNADPEKLRPLLKLLERPTKGDRIQ